MRKLRAVHALMAVGLLAGWAAQGYAQEVASQKSLLGRTGEYKGYPKRERVMIGSSKAVSPAQYHEVYGTRVDVGGGFERNGYKTPDGKGEVKSPSVTARALYGGDIVTLGVQGNYTASRAKVNAVDQREEYDVKKVTPILAVTLTDYLTVAASSDTSFVTVKERAGGDTGGTYKYQLNRPVVGLSLHNPRGEFGVVYATMVKASDRDANATVGPTLTAFTSARQSAENVRDIYIPAHFMAYGRGNLSDSLSVFGAVAHTQYDGNTDGAIPAFNKYRRDDRLYGTLQATYWWPNWTRLTATADYRGATYAPYGSEENGFGYHLANLYGGGLNLEVRTGEATYLGAFATYMRGERNETVDSVAYNAREDKFSVGGNVSVNM